MSTRRLSSRHRVSGAREGLARDRVGCAWWRGLPRRGALVSAEAPEKLFREIVHFSCGQRAPSLSESTT